MADITGGSAEPLSPGALGGRRMRMRKVSAKTIRRTLRKLRMKPKGRVVLKGGEAPAPVGHSESASSTLQTGPSGGRRRRGTRKTRRGRKSRRSLFGLRY